jgi:hypothetical protein
MATKFTFFNRAVNSMHFKGAVSNSQVASGGTEMRTSQNWRKLIFHVLSSEDVQDNGLIRVKGS